MPTLSVQNVAKSYPTPTEPLVVLQDVTFDLGGGDSMAIVGPSGSGKSTLLQILGTLDRPDSGSVNVDGEDPFALSESDCSKWRNEKIGFIFQDHHLLPQLSVIENTLLPSLADGQPDAKRVDRARMLLESVGLSERVTHLPSELSGGERERVAIARALLMEPSLILADEPTGNLDRKTADAVTELLLELQQNSGAILICVTHSESLADSMKSKRTLLDGKLTEGA